MGTIYPLSKGEFRQELQGWGPRINSLKDISEFITTRSKLRPEKLVVPWTNQAKYRGIIAVRFSEPIRAVCGDLDDMYFVDIKGGKNNPLSIRPLEIRGDLFLLEPQLGTDLVTRESSVLCNVYALALPESETLHLIDFDYRETKDTDRFNGTPTGHSDVIRYT